ncbi:MAG: STAS domain-containing protein [Planctomycetes bacterium]|nr:STAS domain-containing protein [Planctomycetota bacterium]
MAKMSHEKVAEVLWITGNVDRSMESDLGRALEQYVRDVPAERRVIEMSGVRYFASSSAKILIAIAQDLEEKGNRLKVLASPPVAQTLNLLGAKSWLDLEVFRQPNNKDEAKAAAVPPPAPAATPAAPVAAANDEEEDAGKDNGQASTAETLRAKKSGFQTAVATARTRLSGTRAKVEEIINAAALNAGEPLVPPDQELPPELGLLRQMKVLDSCTIHFAEPPEALTCRVIEHLGGNWILAEAHNTLRVINTQRIAWLDMLT